MHRLRATAELSLQRFLQWLP